MYGNEGLGSSRLNEVVLFLIVMMHVEMQVLCIPRLHTSELSFHSVISVHLFI